MASKIITKTAAAIRTEYEAAAAKCEQIAVNVRRAEPELQKRVQAELGKMGLDLQAAIAAKRKLWTAWEQARDAEAESAKLAQAQAAYAKATAIEQPAAA